SQQISATGGTGTYTFTATGVPAGLTLSAAGLLSGTPTAPGNFTLSVQAKDTANGSATASITLAIQAAPLSITTTAPLFAGSVASGSYSLVVNTPALSILVSGQLQQGKVGEAYSQTLPVQATGGTQPYTWAITAGLPPGLNFDPSTRILSGTPTAAGTFNMTVQVADAAGLTTTRTLALTIGSAALSITTARQLPDAVINQPYSQSLTATGGQPPY